MENTIIQKLPLKLIYICGISYDISNLPDHKQSGVPSVVVTIHDVCPAFSSKIFEFTEELEGLDIKYNIALGIIHLNNIAVTLSLIQKMMINAKVSK
jgi:hypothetical protein